MTVIQEYTQSLLLPHLQSLALNKPQRAIVIADVSRRLESLLFHWGDLAFRRTILSLGTEEAFFWEPSTASVEVRSLVVVAIRNSLIEDLGALHPFTKALELRKNQLRDEQIPSITSEATKYFETANLDAVRIQPRRDLFEIDDREGRKISQYIRWELRRTGKGHPVLLRTSVWLAERGSVCGSRN